MANHAATWSYLFTGPEAKSTIETEIKHYGFTTLDSA